MHFYCPWKPQDDFRTPRTRVTDRYEPQFGCQKQNLGPMKEQAVFLTIQPISSALNQPLKTSLNIYLHFYINIFIKFNSKLILWKKITKTKYRGPTKVTVDQYACTSLSAGSDTWETCWRLICIKRQVANILGFTDQLLPIACAQLMCHESNHKWHIKMGRMYFCATGLELQIVI